MATDKKNPPKKESGEWNPQVQLPSLETVVVPSQKVHGDFGQPARFKTLRHVRSLRYLNLTEVGPLYGKLVELAEKYTDDKELMAVIEAIKKLG